jgi:hypothetical protein
MQAHNPMIQRSFNLVIVRIQGSFDTLHAKTHMKVHPHVFSASLVLLNGGTFPILAHCPVGRK